MEAALAPVSQSKVEICNASANSHSLFVHLRDSGQTCVSKPGIIIRLSRGLAEEPVCVCI